MNRKRLLILAVVLILGLMLAIAPSAFAAESVTVKLLDSHGVGLAGGQVKWADGSWHDAGTTGSDGTLTFDVSNSSWSKIVVTYHQVGWEKSNAQCLADSYTWQTIDAGIKLVDHSGAGLPGGVVQQGVGSWVTIGTTGADGTVPWEVFPSFANYQFRMIYGHTSETRTGVSVPAAVFQTGELTLHFSGNIRSNLGGSWWNFAKPSMEFLPGTIPIGFAGGSYPEKWMSYDIVAGTSIEESVAYVLLLDSAKKGLADGVAQYYDSGWKSIPGSTGTDGALLYGIPGSKGNLTFKMSYAGASLQKAQNIAFDSFVIFQTAAVTMKLLASDGTTEETGTGQYYASGWRPFGNTPATMELLPTTYTFSVTYKGATIQMAQNVANGNTLVVFKTAAVTMKLLDSSGTELAGQGKYYASGWNDFGTTPTTATMELLPTTYTFSVTYKGATIQMAQNVANGNTLVVFKTAAVTMKLLASDGTTEETGTGQYYASGWRPFGNTPATMELLPTTYTFSVTYKGATIQMAQNVANGNTLVVFKTAAVTMKLLDSSGTELAGQGKYYASGWNDFGNTPATMELLPTTYTFSVTYKGATIQMAQNVANGNTLVVFKTAAVTMKLLDSSGTELAGQGKYYASGWNDFGTTPTTATMELLPTTYTFAVTYNDAQIQKSQNVANGNTLVVFTGTEVTIQFSGTIQYYAAGWKTFTKPTMTLLPGTYTFSFSGNGYPAVNVTLNVTGNQVKKSVVYVRLLSSTNAGLAGGSASAYVNGWKTLGTTAGNGAVVALFDGLLGNTAVSMGYAGGSIQKSQNLLANSFVDFQTAKVTMNLLASQGNPLKGKAEYYGSTWTTFGSGETSTTMELLPTTYSFRVTYAGATVVAGQNVASSANVVFNTVLVTMNLLASQGNPLKGKAEYYDLTLKAWTTFGSGETSTTMELLPTTYSFRVTYAGATVVAGQNVASSDVTFRTGQVNGTCTQYFATIWNNFIQDMELLPGSYLFQYPGGPHTFVITAGVVNHID